MALSFSFRLLCSRSELDSYCGPSSLFCWQMAAKSFYRRLFLIAIPVRYALIALYILNWSDELPRIAIAWKYSPAYVLGPLVLFLAGHIVIWLTFVRLD